MSFDLMAHEHTLTEPMTEKQRLLYFSEVKDRKREKSMAVILALLLGGIGGHHFYLGKTIWGILSIVFCATFIPMIIAVCECLGPLQRRVDNYNKNVMTEVAKHVELLTRP